MQVPETPTYDSALETLRAVIRTARRNRCNLATHRVYAPKARQALADFRKSFLRLKRDYPQERFPGVALHIATAEPSVDKIVSLFPAGSDEMLILLDDLIFRAQTDLAVHLEAEQTSPSSTTATSFLPDDLIPEQQGILRRILWEINRCYDTACYNACAAMIRRLTESLIVGAFEHHGIEARLKKGDDFLPFGDLIGKAAAEPALRLTKNTKRLLPELKFFGDFGAHNRMALVRKQDLDRLHNSLRGAIEELAGNL